MKISPQASLPGGVKVSNGDSGSYQEQDYAKIIITDLGTNFFTVDVRGIELTDEQREGISSEILNVILARTALGSSMPRDPAPDDPGHRGELDQRSGWDILQYYQQHK
jgi:hypothetical protein